MHQPYGLSPTCPKLAWSSHTLRPCHVSKEEACGQSGSDNRGRFKMCWIIIPRAPPKPGGPRQMFSTCSNSRTHVEMLEHDPIFRNMVLGGEPRAFANSVDETGFQTMSLMQSLYQTNASSTYAAVRNLLWVDLQRRAYPCARKRCRNSQRPC